MPQKRALNSDFTSMLILSLVIFVFESLIPRPLPWMKIGLANVVTLVSFTLFPLGTTFRLVMYRIIIGALFLGTFATPGFWLSLSGALLSWLIMATLWKWGVHNLILLSIHGAVFHYIGQLTMAWIIFIKSEAIIGLVPYLIFGATVSGMVVGWIATELTDQLRKTQFE